MDWYISLRYKGLGAQKVNHDSIRKSTENDQVYLVRSTFYTGMEYEEMDMYLYSWQDPDTLVESPVSTYTQWQIINSSNLTPLL